MASELLIICKLPDDLTLMSRSSQRLSELLIRYYQGLGSNLMASFPFGRKHRGKTISQCRDKDWLLWTRMQAILVKKVGQLLEIIV